MTNDETIFWLKGFFDARNEPPTAEQWGVIRYNVLSSGQPVERVLFSDLPAAAQHVFNNGCKDCGPPKSGTIVPLPTLDEDKLR